MSAHGTGVCPYHCLPHTNKCYPFRLSRGARRYVFSCMKMVSNNILMNDHFKNADSQIKMKYSKTPSNTINGDFET